MRRAQPHGRQRQQQAGGRADGDARADRQHAGRGDRPRQCEDGARGGAEGEEELPQLAILHRGASLIRSQGQETKRGRMADRHNPQMPRFDLQSHSTVSDGALPPAEVVARAAAAGIELLALTDHDSVDGVDAALESAHAHGIRLVPAAELSAVDGEHEDLHVLGYGFDHRDPALLAALREFRADRGARVGRMAQALRELGLAAELPDRGGLPVGRPHLAAAVHGEPANRARLEAEGLRTPADVLVAYLVPGAPGYRRRTMPAVADAIALIHAAGGVAVWAHPFWNVDRDEDALDAIERFQQAGLDGVEAFYVTHTRAQTELLARTCAERGLLSTGSADFHGPEHPHFHAFGAFETYGLEPELGPIGAWPPRGPYAAPADG